MDFGLYQQQTTSLIMTQQLRQAISLLQFSAQELSTFVKEQAEENPLIEWKEEVPQTEQKIIEDTRDEYKTFDGDIHYSPFDHLSNKDVTLAEHLSNQIRFLPLSETDRQQLEYLALNINEVGYLQRSLEELAEVMGVTSEEVERYVYILQSLEPVGVGARSLSECLLLQMRAKPVRDPLAEVIIENYLEMLAEKKWKLISKDLSVTMEEIQRVYDEIQTLEPRPGANFGGEPTRYITPDVTVEEVEGELIVIVNDDFIPKLTFNRQYRALLSSNENSEATDFVKKKYQHLQWLMKSIHQRQLTLYRVTEAIVKHQRKFFEEGVKALRPLTLKQIAEELGIHESTVSRATTNKYAQTPKGTFELKYFFHTAIASTTAEENSSSAYVKQLLKQIIEEEDKTKPLSDQKIVKLLEEKEGVSISRRAIAKYREELGIPSSSMRKRFD